MALSVETVFVTGASGGIGRAVVSDFARLGVKRLLISARDPQGITLLEEELQVFDCEVVSFLLDLTEQEHLFEVIEDILQKYGPVDIFVNCAGIAHQSLFIESDINKSYEEISLNLIAAYSLTMLVAQNMISHHQPGIIVNVSSLSALIPSPTMATYSATKAALLAFSEALRFELSGHSIRMQTLLPSLTTTEMVKSFTLFRGVKALEPEKVSQALIKGLERKSPLILVGWQSFLAVAIYRISPWLMEKIIYWTSPLLNQPNFMFGTTFEEALVQYWRFASRIVSRFTFVIWLIVATFILTYGFTYLQ